MNGVRFHTEVFRDLSLVRKEGEAYRELLFDLLGVDGEMIISTSEHVAPFNTSSTVSFMYPQLLLQEFSTLPKTKIIMLAASLIPLDNADYPQGFFLPSNKKIEKINVFSNKHIKKSPLLLEPVVNFKSDSYLFDTYPFIKNAFTLKHETYAHQMSCIMEKMANRWFSSSSSPTLNVYPLESIASKLLIKLIEENDKIITSILFEKKTRNHIIDSLFNVFCAWGNKKGSVFFWKAQGNGKVKPFDITSDGRLIERNNESSFDLEKECILENLKNGMLLPSVYLSFLLVSYLPNIPIAGGRKQLYYYRHMITATNDVLNIDRTIELSVFGYDGTVLRNDEYITKFGTGLNLTNSDLDLEYYYDALKNSQINNPLDVFYD